MQNIGSNLAGDNMLRIVFTQTRQIKSTSQADKWLFQVIKHVCLNRGQAAIIITGVKTLVSVLLEQQYCNCVAAPAKKPSA